MMYHISSGVYISTLIADHRYSIRSCQGPLQRASVRAHRPQVRVKSWASELALHRAPKGYITLACLGSSTLVLARCPAFVRAEIEPKPIAAPRSLRPDRCAHIRTIAAALQRPTFCAGTAPMDQLYSEYSVQVSQCRLPSITTKCYGVPTQSPPSSFAVVSSPVWADYGYLVAAPGPYFME